MDKGYQESNIIIRYDYIYIKQFTILSLKWVNTRNNSVYNIYEAIIKDILSTWTKLITIINCKKDIIIVDDILTNIMHIDIVSVIKV